MRAQPMAELTVETECIELFDDVVEDFLERILGMQVDSVLVTDLSTLSDFSFSGPYRSKLPAGASLRELFNEWDAWVVQRIAMVYGIPDARPNMRLIELFARIESLSTTVH